MKKLEKLLAVVLITIAAISCGNKEKILTVGYLQITQDPVLDIAKEGVFTALRDSGYTDGQNFRLIEKNAQGDLSMIPMILQSFISSGVDVIITCGTPCMIAAAQIVKDIPVVFTVSFEPDAMGLKKVPENLYGIYDPLNEVQYVNLMFELIPNLKRVGIPFNNAEPNAEFSAGKFTAEFSKRGVEVVKTSVVSSNDILMAGQYLAGEDVDAILVTADNTMYLGINVMAKVASDAKIPLFVSDPMHTRKGAAVGFGVNYWQWGYMSGLKAVRLLKGMLAGEKIEPIDKLELVINKDASEKQGLPLPDSIIKRADIIL